MVSGSLALNVYSIPRMTMDIDIVIELDRQNLPHFLELFKSGYYIDSETVREEISRKGMFNVIDHTTGLKIDFIIRKDTEYRRLEFARKVLKVIDDFPIWFVSPEDLIISKLDWIQQIQSDKQLHDIRILLSLPGIDIQYIQYWCKELKFETFGLF